jgi:APA family basic amino acid/polyamine antiporter
LWVLSIDEIAGQDMAVAVAAERVFGSSGGRIVFLVATISILVACNAGTLQTPRVLFAMSRDRLFFPQAAHVNAGGTPTISLALTTMAIAAFIAASTLVAAEKNGAVEKTALEILLGVLAFFLIASYSIVFTALFVLRVREPEAPRPFRAWGYPWTPGLALLGSLVYLGSSIWTDHQTSLYALGMLGASVPLFWLMRLMRR